ncbi:MAG: ParA family protein [Alphaproteobacteria bacterium]|jgi:chromosome partitioning protein|nr:ParA family protein [Alphaproteobacteria bacterium]
MDTKILSVINQKGGVGKTTTVINLASALAIKGKRVLIIDLDPQGNSSTGLGIDENNRVKNIYNCLVSNDSIKTSIKKTSVQNLDIVPATVDLAGAEVEISETEHKLFTLKKRLEGLENLYDFILLDCPPSLGLLTLSSLTASTGVLIPVQCEFFALEGITHLVKTISVVQKTTNPNLIIEGLVMTMYDKRNRLSSLVKDDIEEVFGNKVFYTRIPRNVRVSEAPSYGKPVITYDEQCPGSQAYIRLANELLKRI